ncbi:putative cytochrome p450 protein [Neofusicoccum parvum]|uniref:Cytochrome p450 protein n=1 Tax=Neofusicoccum parvum TaxID=310453 RepID=A0ACB5SAQ7_9PEZI|nr:putative cytochrome p450 protein [Neofusicoccum parvum]
MTPYLNIGTAAASAVGLFIVSCIYTAIYNFCFHPLRKFPGPISAAVSNWPFIIARARGIHPHRTARLHAQYGDVVRIAPNELSFISAEAWRDIYGHKIAGKGGLPKDRNFYGTDVVGSNSIIRTNDADHSRQRRLLAHAFSDKALREQEPLIRKYVDLLIEKMQDVARTPSASIDMVRYYNCCTFDIMADLTFGEPLGLLEQSDYTPWVAAVFASLKTNNIRALVRTYFSLTSTVVDKLLMSESDIVKRKLHVQHSIDRVDRRLECKTDRPDIMAFVLRHNDEKGMTRTELHANGSVLMIAGTETTATLLSGVTYYLLRDKHVLDKLTAEIRGVFKSPEEMNMTTLGQLPYLRAVLDEGLRMYPPVPAGLPRVVPPEGRIICGNSVPGGAIVTLSQYAAYHSASNFHKPESFLPERWLSNSEPRFANDEHSVVEPFSYGPRNCIGKNLAYHEMRLILASVLWHFDLQICDESVTWPDQSVYTVWEKSALMTTIAPAARA